MSRLHNSQLILPGTPLQADSSHPGGLLPAERPRADRRIAHLDMDAFYASVELLRRPDLKGKPVAIGGRGDPNSRGVVTTATYAAREYGIRSGMALRKAVNLCPDCVFLPTDFDEYKRYSKLFKSAVAGITDRIEDRGIDEIYIDLTEAAGVNEQRGLVLANRIRQAVRDATGGLTCSMGLAPNKLIAKLASEINKPDGVAIVEAGDVQRVLWPMPAKRLNGIGPKADQKLRELGIETIGDLARTDPQTLLSRFGSSYGRWLHEAAWGRDERDLVTHSEPISRSRETTFERDLHLVHDWQQLAGILARLSQQLADDLQRRGYAGRSIGVKVRFDDFRIQTRDTSVELATNDATAIRRIAFECLARVPKRRRLRLLGVKVAGLMRSGEQPSDAQAARHTARESATARPYTPDLFSADPAGPIR